MITSLFTAIDNKDTHLFLSHLSEDCVFRFANIPSVSGQSNVGQFVDGFFSSIQSIKHDINDVWETETATICHGTVTYTRLNETVLQVPFANVLKIKNGKITDYLIYVDASEL